MWILPRLTTAPRRRPLLQLDFPFTHHRVTLAVFAQPMPAIPNEHQQWFPLRALDRLPVATPHRRALAQLLPNRLLKNMLQGQKIVVVMPAYNAARTLRQTYDEVMAHGIVDRVILVDDGSKDETAAMARALPQVQVEVHPQESRLWR